MACFMGHAEIVRELVLRGAKINFKDNREPTSPLSMALRGAKTEVIKVLIERRGNPGRRGHRPDRPGAMLARWKAQHFGASTAANGEKIDTPVVEEIQMVGCYGTDTSVLEADVMRYARGTRRQK